MGTFDPDTGVRLRAEVPQAAGSPAVPRPVRNPYEVALAVLWISAGSLSIVLLLAAASLSEDAGDTNTALGAPALGAAAALALIGALVGVLHLAVRAIRWRAPER